MPMVLPAPVRPLAYSGLTLYFRARSATVQEPGVLVAGAAAVGRTACISESPASAPVFGTAFACVILEARLPRPETETATPANCAGITAGFAGASYVVPA